MKKTAENTESAEEEGTRGISNNSDTNGFEIKHRANINLR